MDEDSEESTPQFEISNLTGLSTINNLERYLKTWYIESNDYIFHVQNIWRRERAYDFFNSFRQWTIEKLGAIYGNREEKESNQQNNGG